MQIDLNRHKYLLQCSLFALSVSQWITAPLTRLGGRKTSWKSTGRCLATLRKHHLCGKQNLRFGCLYLSSTQFQSFQILHTILYTHIPFFTMSCDHVEEKLFHVHENNDVYHRLQSAEQIESLKQVLPQTANLRKYDAHCPPRNSD